MSENYVVPNTVTSKGNVPDFQTERQQNNIDQADAAEDLGYEKQVDSEMPSNTQLAENQEGVEQQIDSEMPSNIQLAENQEGEEQQVDSEMPSDIQLAENQERDDEQPNMEEVEESQTAVVDGVQSQQYIDADEPPQERRIEESEGNLDPFGQTQSEFEREMDAEMDDELNMGFGVPESEHAGGHTPDDSGASDADEFADAEG